MRKLIISFIAISVSTMTLAKTAHQESYDRIVAEHQVQHELNSIAMAIQDQTTQQSRDAWNAREHSWDTLK